MAKALIENASDQPERVDTTASALRERTATPALPPTPEGMGYWDAASPKNPASFVPNAAPASLPAMSNSMGYWDHVNYHTVAPSASPSRSSSHDTRAEVATSAAPVPVSPAI